MYVEPYYSLHRCPKRVIIVPNSGVVGGHSAGTSSTGKALYAGEGNVDDSTHERGHCNHFGDTKPAFDDGNSAAATAITIESPDTSATEDSSPKTTPSQINRDIAEKPHLKKSRLPKTSVCRVLGKCQPQALLGMHVCVNPVYHGAVKAQLVSWAHPCTETLVKEDTACLHNGEQEGIETTRHVHLLVQ